MNNLVLAAEVMSARENLHAQGQGLGQGLSTRENLRAQGLGLGQGPGPGSRPGPGLGQGQESREIDPDTIVKSDEGNEGGSIGNGHGSGEGDGSGMESAVSLSSVNPSNELPQQPPQSQLQQHPSLQYLATAAGEPEQELASHGLSSSSSATTSSSSNIKTENGLGLGLGLGGIKQESSSGGNSGNNNNEASLLSQDQQQQQQQQQQQSMAVAHNDEGPISGGMMVHNTDSSTVGNGSGTDLHPAGHDSNGTTTGTTSTTSKGSINGQNYHVDASHQNTADNNAVIAKTAPAASTTTTTDAATTNTTITSATTTTATIGTNGMNVVVSQTYTDKGLTSSTALPAPGPAQGPGLVPGPGPGQFLRTADGHNYQMISSSSSKLSTGTLGMAHPDEFVPRNSSVENFWMLVSDDCFFRPNKHIYTTNVANSLNDDVKILLFSTYCC